MKFFEIFLKRTKKTPKFQITMRTLQYQNSSCLFAYQEFKTSFSVSKGHWEKNGLFKTKQNLKQRFNVKNGCIHIGRAVNKSCEYLLVQGGVEPYPSGPEQQDLVKCNLVTFLFTKYYSFSFKKIISNLLLFTMYLQFT